MGTTVVLNSNKKCEVIGITQFLRTGTGYTLTHSLPVCLSRPIPLPKSTRSSTSRSCCCCKREGVTRTRRKHWLHIFTGLRGCSCVAAVALLESFYGGLLLHYPILSRLVPPSLINKRVWLRVTVTVCVYIYY